MAPVPKPKRLRERHFIREWREHANLTQERAADRIGMSRENYSKIENGKVPYNQDFLEEAAKAFSCSPADLIMRDPTSPDAIWSIWENLKPAEKNEALTYLQFLRDKGAKKDTAA
jgi:transcriptional regulator with XRE-family HTH domain